MEIYQGDIFVHKDSGEWFAATDSGRRNGNFLNVNVVKVIEPSVKDEWKCQCCGAVHKEGE